MIEFDTNINMIKQQIQLALRIAVIKLNTNTYLNELIARNRAVSSVSEVPIGFPPCI